MAQNYFHNVTLDKAAATKDPAFHSHLVNGSTTTFAGDFTVSYDISKIPTLAVLDSAWAAVRLRAISSGLK